MTRLADREDPFARLVCAADDAEAAQAEAAVPGGVSRGPTGVWTVTDRTLAEQLLDGDAVDLRHPGAVSDSWHTHASTHQRYCHTLDPVDRAMRLRRTDIERLVSLARDLDGPVWQARADEVRAAVDPAVRDVVGTFDLVSSARPALAAAGPAWL